MRALATFLFVLAATLGFAVAGAVVRAMTLWLDGSGGRPGATLASLLDFIAPLVFATGILLALGYAARFAGERGAALAATAGPAPAMPQPRAERVGLWMLRGALLLAGLGLATAFAGTLADTAASGAGLTSFSGYALALRPLLAGAVLAAVGAALRRPRR